MPQNETREGCDGREGRVGRGDGRGLVAAEDRVARPEGMEFLPLPIVDVVGDSRGGGLGGSALARHIVEMTVYVGYCSPNAACNKNNFWRKAHTSIVAYNRRGALRCTQLGVVRVQSEG